MIKKTLTALAGLVVGGAVAAGCGSQATLASSSQGVDLITQIQQAPLLEAHGGVRLLESHYQLDGGSDRLVYRERVVTDGQGSFAITPLGVVSGGTLPQADFQLLQKAREGFHFRYRDFLVRDLAAFLTNYELETVGQLVQVAGRDCLELSIRRKDQTLSFDLAMDVATGLVLRYHEYDAHGQLYTSMVYESFDPTPDLVGVTFHTPGNQEQQLDLSQPVLPQLGFQPYVPKLPPGTGYTFVDASRVVDVHGQTWAKLTYTDGVETLFFLDGGPTQAQQGELGDKQPGAQTAGATSAGGTSMSDRLQLFHEGPLTVAWGEVMAHRMIAVGKIDRSSMVTLIESALPHAGL